MRKSLQQAFRASIVGGVLAANACRSEHTSAGLTSICSPDSSFVDFAFSIHPVDAQTNARLSAVIVATDGSYNETLAPGPGAVPGGPPDGYFGVRNRPGLYRLTVSVTGYAVWSRDSLRVQRDANCRIATLSITPQLSRAPVP